MKLKMIYETVGHWQVIEDHPGLTPHMKKELRKKRKKRKKKKNQNLSFRVDQ
jgi:hypothetical protein